jgi:hypothetical protein
LRRAGEHLAADPDAALPARALWIHGFADATGVATDLLARLLKRPGAKLVLDRPPDPARPGAEEAAFTERLAQALAPGARLTAAAAAGTAAAPSPAPVPPLRFAAPGAEAETREVAVRIGELLADGMAPERIGVVARDLSPYRRAIRRHFGRLGVPFSGVGERGSSTPAGRRAAALLDLLAGGAASPCDRWLDAAVSLRPVGAAAPGLPARGRLPVDARRRVDLRLAIRALGAGRLADLAALDPGDIARLLRDGRFPLPIRQGLRAAPEPNAEAPAADAADGADPETESNPHEAEDDGVSPVPRDSRAAARSVPGDELAGARSAAAALAARLAAWPAEASAAEHLARLTALLGDELGWSLGSARRGRRADLAPVFAAMDELAADLPAGFPITLAELARLLGRALAATPDAGTDPLGGAGGGVQVLSVTEARGRTFERLFVLGLNRDVFPRTVREDPLFPDALRAVLRGPGGDGVLPDVPIKAAGFDEERYLFAQLLAAAPAVTLSWQAADDDGRPLAASPLLARAAGAASADGTAGAQDPPALAPALHAPGPAARPARPARPAFEEAILAGLHAGRERWRPLLPAAIAEARAELDGGGAQDPARAPAALAAIRLAVLDEMDPDRGTPEGRAVRLLPGPYFGFLGRTPRGVEDPRHGDLYVTVLEAFAACPWQTFLERFLRIEPTPDPLAALPGLDPLLVGNVVHAVLEAIVARSRGGHPAAAKDPAAMPGWAGRAPLPVPWPEPAELERLLAAAAERATADEGIALRGLARALAERARPFLAAAEMAEWGDPSAPPQALGAELRGALRVEGGSGEPRPLFFKADRVDAWPAPAAGGTGAAGLVLTDYKTGKPFAAAKTPEARRRAFLRRVREGKSLQAVAYGLGGGAEAVGRYLFLRPELEADRRAVEVAPGDAAAVDGFRHAVAAVLAAWDAGVMFPRLVDVAGRQEPARCKLCRVAEACLRGDSGARSRLLAYAGRAAEEDGRTAEAAAFSAVWLLAAGDAAPSAAPAEAAREAAEEDA